MIKWTFGGLILAAILIWYATTPRSNTSPSTNLRPTKSAMNNGLYKEAAHQASPPHSATATGRAPAAARAQVPQPNSAHPVIEVPAEMRIEIDHELNRDQVLEGTSLEDLYRDE